MESSSIAGEDEKTHGKSIDKSTTTANGLNVNQQNLRVLETALLQVDSLQHSLLQANNDAMRISSRILQYLI